MQDLLPVWRCRSMAGCPRVIRLDVKIDKVPSVLSAIGVYAWCMLPAAMYLLAKHLGWVA